MEVRFSCDKAAPLYGGFVKGKSYFHRACLLLLGRPHHISLFR